jgi:uncharacterized protein YlxW (UPF0749 family)
MVGMVGIGTSVELVALRCPNCGADLRVAQGLEIATCNYCGSQVVITERAQPGALGTDVDRKRAAIGMQRQELAAHEADLARLNAEIKALEESTGALRADNLMIVVILAGAGIFFDLFLFPLFFFLDITRSFGMARGVCLALGMTILVICLAVMALAWNGRKRAAARRREEVLQSSEYQRRLQRRKELEDEIRAMQSDIDRSEGQLMRMLDSVGPPPQGSP